MIELIRGLHTDKPLYNFIGRTTDEWHGKMFNETNIA